MQYIVKKFVIPAATAAIAFAGLGLQSTARAQASVSIQIGSAPPAPRFERVPPARRGYVWSPGHWERRHGRHEWVGGSWLRARPGYAYRAPQWTQHDGRWQYERGRWDRDGDGVPDRHDRRPNDPRRY
ncbi:MAG: hypothetical protein EPO12_19445 [Aquabacterium sp.]|nr:MAG: hypothetical protein EPO12_19445 [Aquabacterium sp.]